MDQPWSHQVGMRTRTCDSRNGQSISGELMSNTLELPTGQVDANNLLPLKQLFLTFFLRFICESYPGYGELVFPAVCPRVILVLRSALRNVLWSNRRRERYSSGSLMGIPEVSRDSAGSSSVAYFVNILPRKAFSTQTLPSAQLPTTFRPRLKYHFIGIPPDRSLARKHDHSCDFTSVGLSD